VRRTVWAWIRVLGGLAIIGGLSWRLGTGAFREGLRAIDGGTLLVAAGIGLLTTVFSAWRWCLVAKGLGVRLPLRGAVADYYRSLFLNAALPGGVLGDVDRAVRNGRDTGDVGRGVRAVVLERSAGQITLVAVGVAVLVATGLVSVPVVLAIAGAAIVLGVLLRRRRLLARIFGEVRRGLLARRTGPWIALSSAVVLAGHLATFLVAARAAGASAPIGRLIPLMVLALLAMALPLNVGGWGPREGVLAWAFGAAGMSASLGLTIAVVYGVLAFVASLPGAGVLLVRWALSMRASARASRSSSVRGAPARASVRSSSVCGAAVRSASVRGAAVRASARPALHPEPVG
jgi:uncharacterized membrane protein YbhN (UPF0104 family)